MQLTVRITSNFLKIENVTGKKYVLEPKTVSGLNILISKEFIKGRFYHTFHPNFKLIQIHLFKVCAK